MIGMLVLAFFLIGSVIVRIEHDPECPDCNGAQETLSIFDQFKEHPLVRP
jgi:hypothetical protein